MGEIVLHSTEVTSWGRAARHAGDGIKGTRSKVAEADDNVESAGAGGLASAKAFATYSTMMRKGIRTVAEDVTGVGDKLVSTASIVRQYDQANVDEFAPVQTRLRTGENP